jgi:hypothetical protein
MNKERIERLHLEQFLKLISSLPIIAMVQPQGEPDFVFQVNEKTIGLEHTRLIRLPDERGVNIKAHTVNADRIVAFAEAILNTKNNICLRVAVDFKCTYGLAVSPPVQLESKDTGMLSQFIADFVEEKLQDVLILEHLESIIFEAFDWNAGRYIFPDKIQLIRIQNTSAYKTPCWFNYEGGTIPSIYESIEFKTRLSEKNKKPKHYINHYDEIWLLLVEDSMELTSYFDFDETEPVSIQFHFDRVFILRRSKNEYIELPCFL